MPKERHKGRRFQVWIKDNDLSRFDRLTSGKDSERFVQLLDIAEKRAEGETEKIRALRTKVATLETQKGKLFEDFHNAKDKIEELENQLEEEKRLREEQKQLSKIQSQPQPNIEYREVVKEVPKYVERTVEKIVEKTVYKDHPLANMQILCVLGKGFVSVTEECMRKCQDIAGCPYYTSIAVEKKIPQGAKLKI